MTSASPSDGLDLVVVGGLTVDRFTDGSSAPGGAVLHIARALAAGSVQLGIVTTVGPEPEAAAGLAELRDLAASVEASASTTSITFGHTETAAGRELLFERRGGQVPVLPAHPAHAVLFAPVADEILTASLVAGGGAVRGGVLQGWLRRLDEGEPVRSQPISALDPDLVEALGGLDLVIGSSEDLRADGRDARSQLRALRATLGDRPPLVVTDGARGVWLDDGSGPRQLPLRDGVAGVSTIGAGDMFAAFMLLALAGSAGADPAAAARTAMGAVTDVLRGRRGA
ncbi:MAG TPA: PfkB family carbohydrate kinase [Candidatus Limnocylindria bacterium]|nr:PfkB family carbohydrate kinase [Candidatus Limnocylindria bacterium]